MDIKLNMMKKKLILILIVFTYSCSTKKIANTYSYNKKEFKKEFKFQAYCNCILYGYEDKLITTKMKEMDKSFYNPVIQSLFSKQLKEIGLNEAKTMKLDSLNSIQKVSEAMAGKKILSHCLTFYSGKKLDSIANYNFKVFENIKNLDSIIAKEIPNY